MSFKILLSLAVCLVVVSGKSLQNSRDVVWFPNPNGDGSLIEARLYPSPEISRAGNISDIHLLLHTGNNQDTPDELFVGDVEALDNSHFIRGRPVRILIHGFGGAIDHGFPMETYKEFLVMDPNQNTILVDWETLAESPDYFGAVANAQLTSRLTADLIDFLVAEEAVKREDVHVIGYSLGGQVAGQVGSRVSEKLTRITALDPALPLFDVADLHNRTDPSDAHFVDVIHTAGIIVGYFDPLGTVDFYPNGGKVQPGCGVDITGSCAHSRAPSFFKESLRTTVGFNAVHCANWTEFQTGSCDNNTKVLMGYHTPHTTTGSLYLTTNEESPFAQG